MTQIDSAALAMATDLYAEQTGDVDDLTMAAAILVYLEAVLDHQSTEELKRYEREREEAARFHDQEPGRWGDHASPRRMRRDIARERDEDRTMGTG